MKPNPRALEANCNAYEYALETIRALNAVREPEAVAQAIQRCAWMAGEFHPGRFSDGTLENLALDIGCHIESSVPTALSAHRPLGGHTTQLKRVLHVAPSLSLGGHGRLMAHWIASDRQSRHSVALTAPGGMVPEAFARLIHEGGGTISLLGNEPRLCGRALELRVHARREADLVVWHLVSPDVVPVIAFAAQDGPPVVLVDHADHMFWLGSSIADVIVNLRSAAVAHTTQRRFAQRSFVLPIPLKDRVGEVTREQARDKLKWAPDRTVLLSVGREMKYRPCGSYDFLCTAGKVLDRHPHADLYVVGASLEGLRPWLHEPLHDRIHLLGSIADPSTYHAAADIYLESFPYGSQTALLEAALSGLPVVPAYAPLFPLFVANDDALTDLLPNPPNEQHWMELADGLISSIERRVELGRALRERLLADHVGPGWARRLEHLHQALQGVEHATSRIALRSKQVTNADVGMSEWRSDVASEAIGVEADEKTVLAIHRALTARLAENFVAARRGALGGIARSPFNVTLWRILLVSVLGRKAKIVKRWRARLQTRLRVTPQPLNSR